MEKSSSMEKVAPDYITANPDSSSGAVFEDYLHYAALQRREEDIQSNIDPNIAGRSWLNRLSAHKGPNVIVDINARGGDEGSMMDSMTVTEAERVNALRALKSASWASVFYLITTDILGPFNAPYAISQVGWVPGRVLLSELCKYILAHLLPYRCHFVLLQFSICRVML